MLGTCPSLTMHENFELSAGRRWWLPAPIRWNLRDDDRTSLRKTGLSLEGKTSTPLNMLSGGQRQAVALCLAFASHNAVLLFDEFTAALDDCAADCVVQFTTSELLTRKVTMLTVLHDTRRLPQVAGRAITLKAGRIQNDEAIFPGSLGVDADVTSSLRQE